MKTTAEIIEKYNEVKTGNEMDFIKPLIATAALKLTNVSPEILKVEIDKQYQLIADKFDTLSEERFIQLMRYVMACNDIYMQKIIDECLAQ